MAVKGKKWKAKMLVSVQLHAGGNFRNMDDLKEITSSQLKELVAALATEIGKTVYHQFPYALEGSVLPDRAAALFINIELRKMEDHRNG